MFKTIEKYFKNHPFYHSSVHLLGGVGIGILITYPFIGPHPVRWGIGFLVVSVIGHIYPMTLNKK